MEENKEQQVDEKIDEKIDEQQELEKLFHQLVTNFKLRWMNKTPPTYISSTGLNNYAISLMRYEFHKKFDSENEKRILEQYKP